MYRLGPDICLVTIKLFTHPNTMQSLVSTETKRLSSKAIASSKASHFDLTSRKSIAICFGLVFQFQPFQTQAFLGDIHYVWKLNHNSADATPKTTKNIPNEGYGSCLYTD